MTRKFIPGGVMVCKFAGLEKKAQASDRETGMVCTFLRLCVDMGAYLITELTVNRRVS